MGMCKGCKEVFSTLEMKDGYCKDCNNLSDKEIQHRIKNKKISVDLDYEASKLNQITLKNKVTGLTKIAPVGFSWTTLLFGVFVPLFRGDIKWFIITVILAVITFGLGWLLIPFFYNNRYIVDLIEKGYEPTDELTKKVLEQQNIIKI